MSDQQPNLFESSEPQPLESLPERIRVMYERYGLYGGNLCSECIHLEYHRCKLTRQEGDWRTSWTACGKFEDK